MSDECALWKKRIQLAESKSKFSLASQAQERLEELEAEKRSIALELESIDMQKSQLRYESRRPSGDEVERAELLVEMAKLNGYLDDDAPRRSETDEDVEFDFSQD